MIATCKSQRFAITVFALAAALFLSACGGKSDADLQKASADKLAADKITGVSVTVKDGVATLTGEVADQTIKAKAEQSAKVDGIKSVTNNITLKALPPAAPPPADKMLEGTINESLKKKNIPGITVTVADGAVTLTGEVDSKAKLAEVMAAASEAKPKHIENKVTVKK